MLKNGMIQKASVEGYPSQEIENMQEKIESFLGICQPSKGCCCINVKTWHFYISLICIQPLTEVIIWDEG